MRHDKPRFKGISSAEGIVDVLTNRIINVGAPTAGTDAARLQDIPPGFYGNTVKLTDGSVSFSGISVFSYDPTYFYVEQNDPNTDEAQVSFRPPADAISKVSVSFTSSVEWQMSHNLGTTDAIWSAYDDALEALLPSRADMSDPNTAYFYWAEAVAGKIVMMG